MLLPKKSDELNTRIRERDLQACEEIIRSIYDSHGTLTLVETYLEAGYDLDDESVEWDLDNCGILVTSLAWEEYKAKAFTVLVAEGKIPGVDFSLSEDEIFLEDHCKDILDKQLAEYIDAINSVAHIEFEDMPEEGVMIGQEKADDAMSSAIQEIQEEFQGRLEFQLNERFQSITMPQLNWYLAHVVEGIKHTGVDLNSYLHLRLGDTFMLNLYEMASEENLLWVEDLVLAAGGDKGDATIKKNGNVELTCRGMSLLNAVYQS